jgi:hypothetical protein
MENLKVEKLTKLIPEVLLVGMNIGNRGILDKNILFSDISLYITNSLDILKSFNGSQCLSQNVEIINQRLDLAISMGDELVSHFNHEVVDNLEWEYKNIFPNLNEALTSVFFQEPVKEEVMASNLEWE